MASFYVSSVSIIRRGYVEVGFTLSYRMRIGILVPNGITGFSSDNFIAFSAASSKLTPKCRIAAAPAKKFESNVDFGKVFVERATPGVDAGGVMAGMGVNLLVRGSLVHARSTPFGIDGCVATTE